MKKKKSNVTELKRQPNKLVIQTLREMLELAEEGEVIGIILAANRRDSLSYRVVGVYPRVQIVADLMCLVIDLSGAHVEGATEIVLETKDEEEPSPDKED